MPSTRRPRGRSPGRPPAPVPHELRATAFSYSTARAAGITKDRLGGLSFTRLHRGVYVQHGLPSTTELGIRAMMLSLPESAALYGATAAAWYELPITMPNDRQIIVPPGPVPRRRRGFEPHEGLRPDEVTEHRGVRVTTPERTWLDLSLTLSDTELVVIGDAMTRRLTTPDRLVESADGARRRRRIVRARKLARLVRTGADSPQETRLRLALTNGGLPAPEVNPHVFDQAGGWIGRPDLAYRELKVAIQYDGDVHRTSRKRWRADIARDEVLRDHGWDVVLVTADDLRTPERLCRRVRNAIDRQRRRPLPR